MLFSDIEGSTRLLHDIGDAYGDVLAAHRRLLRRVWYEHGGVEVGTEGDSFLVAFRYAAEAVAAASQAQRALIAAGNELRGVRVRIGVHTGAPRVHDGGYWGADVHYAARLCSAANGGQVLLSASTQGLVADAEVEDLGARSLKDFPAARRIFHLVLDGRHSNAFAPVRTLKSGETNLPDQISSFIGRESELATLRQLVSEHRVVSLVGAGGVGKTRLALRLGSELLDGSGDGVWFVDLAPLIDPGLVAFTVASTLRVPESARQDIVEGLIEAIGDRRLVIVLDNCEHVIEAATALVENVVRRCSGVVVIATSREPLRIAGEQVYRVPSLSAPQESSDPDQVLTAESVQLFVERVRQQRPGFGVIAENAQAVARVCRRLDGIPLAIELAAVRLRALSIDELDARLDRRFSLLTTGSRTALPRQQTLTALIDWSYQLLSPHEQEILTRLSVFAPSGFYLAAAESVCASEDTDPVEVLDHVEALVDKSLVQVEDITGTVRYRLLESIREYAAGKLADAPDRARAARSAHRDHYLELAATTAGAGDRKVRFDRLETEHDNFRLALAHSLTDPDPRPGLALGYELEPFWGSRGYATEGSDHLAQHLARPDAREPTIERARALYSRAILLQGPLGDLRRALPLLEEALGIARREREEHLAVMALSALAAVCSQCGEHERALEACELARPLARSLDDWELLIQLANARGMVLLSLGKDARPEFHVALDLARAHDKSSAAAVALSNLAVVAIIEGDADEARRYCEQAHRTFTELEDPSGRAWALQNLGYVRYLEGDHARASRLFTEALDACERLRELVGIAGCILGTALVAADPSLAATMHGAATAMLTELGYQHEEPESTLQEASETRLRAVLGSRQYDAARHAGTQLSRSEALALTRAALEQIHKATTGIEPV